jgi:hypothetical protein
LCSAAQRNKKARAGNGCGLFFAFILQGVGVGCCGFLRCATSLLSHLGQISILSGITPVSTTNGGKQSPQK